MSEIMMGNSGTVVYQLILPVPEPLEPGKHLHTRFAGFPHSPAGVLTLSVH